MNTRLLTFFLWIISILAIAAIVHIGSSSTPSADALLGHLEPRHSRDIIASPWGIQVGSLRKEDIAKAAAIGVKWTRLQASWKSIEQIRGTYTWDETDSAFAAAREQGITPFVCLTGSNPLYSEKFTSPDPREVEIYGSSIQPPTKNEGALRAWLTFVRETVRRYKTSIRYWEVWNEPNHWAYWGAKPDGKEYGLLLKETSRCIKGEDPSAKVVGGALAGLDPEFIDEFLDDGTDELIDIISFHHYAPLPEERIYKAADTWSVINRHNSHLQLWQGECGYPSHSSTRDYRGTSPWGITIQAKWLLRQAFTDVFYCRTTLSNYFKLIHNGGLGEKPLRTSLTTIDSMLGFPERGGARVKSVGVNEKCLVEEDGSTIKPGYRAYQYLCSVFDGRYTPARKNTKVTVHDAGIFYGIGETDDAFPSVPLVSTFESKRGASLIAFWLPWHPQELIREARIDLRVENMTFREPVLVDLLSGKVLAIQPPLKSDSTIVFHDLPLADYPMVVVERGEIDVHD